MGFEVVIPIEGCENETEFKLSKLDDFFSMIEGVETGVKLRLMSFGALKSVAFEMPEEFMQKLEIESMDDISIYYIFVLQSHVSDSSLDIASPIIINNKSNKIGQIHIDLSELGIDLLNGNLP